MIKMQHIKISPKIYISAFFVFMFLVLLICFRPQQRTNVSDEIKHINYNIRKNYQKQVDYRGLNTETAVKNGLIPPFMVRHGKIFSRLKREILIGRDAEGNTLLPADNYFAVTYVQLDKQMCIDLISSPFDISLGLREITLLDDDSSVTFSYGDTLPLPVTKDLAKEHCRPLNTIVLSFE